NVIVCKVIFGNTMQHYISYYIVTNYETEIANLKHYLIFIELCFRGGDCTEESLLHGACVVKNNRWSFVETFRVFAAHVLGDHLPYAVLMANIVSSTTCNTGQSFYHVVK